jgi:N-acetylmuramoyl-L-alanine amidase
MRVLGGANMPAALVEMVYLTNPEQEQKVQSEDFQSGMVQALYDAVVRFRSYLEASEP